MNIKMKRVFTVIVILVLGLGMLLICTTREQTKVQKLILDKMYEWNPTTSNLSILHSEETVLGMFYQFSAEGAERLYEGIALFDDGEVLTMTVNQVDLPDDFSVHMASSHRFLNEEDELSEFTSCSGLVFHRKIKRIRIHLTNDQVCEVPIGKNSSYCMVTLEKAGLRLVEGLDRKGNVIDAYRPSGFDEGKLYINVNGETLVYDRVEVDTGSLTRMNVLDDFSIETEVDAVLCRVFSVEEYPDLSYVLAYAGGSPWICRICGDSNDPLQTSTEIPESEPYNQLVFQNVEEYHRFFQAVDLSDSEFLEFIRKENYNMNGIRSKEDLIALKQKLMPVPFPYIANAIITDISILPEYDQVSVLYLINGKDRCAFTIDFTDMEQTSRTDEVEQNMHLWNETAFDDCSYDMTRKAYQFLEANNGCSVLFSYFGSKKDARSIIEKNTVFVSAVQEWTDPNETSDTEKDDSTSVLPEASHSLSFQSIEEYWCFFLAAEFTDTEFEKYIEKNGFNRNGIRSKEDLLTLTAKLIPVPFPRVGGADLAFVEIFPERNQLYLQYILNGDDRCTFLIDYTDVLWTEQFFEVEETLQSWNQTVSDDYGYFLMQNAGKLLEEYIQPWNETVFADYSYDEKQNAYQFLEACNGCSVLYSYYGSAADACATIEGNTTFISAIG